MSNEVNEPADGGVNVEEHVNDDVIQANVAESQADEPTTSPGSSGSHGSNASNDSPTATTDNAENANNIDESKSEQNKIQLTCRYFIRGMCRFGTRCNYLHELNNSTGDTEGASTSRGKNWVKAPIFVPSQIDKINELCQKENPCPDGENCSYSLHYELCEMCQKYLLHPNDMEKRRQHQKDCLKKHEEDMELSFGIARSKDKVCGICFDTILEKSGPEKRFGILPKCWHIFCLECIRKWRQAREFKHKITRSCPECRIRSDFVYPSAYWIETQEEKEKLLQKYQAAIANRDCKYFEMGEGMCPFGNKCFYKHALPNGDIVDVGCPKRARHFFSRPRAATMDRIDVIPWNNDDDDADNDDWMEFLSSDSDENDSDWSDDDSNMFNL